MSYKKFVLIFVLAVVLFAFSVVSFNVLSDPYGIWRIGQWQGINRYAIQGEAMERMAKPLAAVAYAPETVILGDSLSNLGLDPKGYEERTGRRTYNMAVDSASPFEMRCYVEHLLKADVGLREIIVEANLAMLYPGDSFQPGFDGQQIGHGFPVPNLIVKSVFSADAIEAGWDSFKLNREELLSYPSHDENGMLSEGQQKRNYDDNWFYNFLQLNLRMGANRDWQIDWNRLDEYRQMKDLCAEHGVKFKIFLPPMSAVALNAMSESYGKATMMQLWKGITDISPMYNFSGIGIWNESASPEDKHFFWDANHMKPELGKMVLAVLAGEDVGWHGFGQIVEASNVQEAVEQQFEEMEKWRQSHPMLWYGASHLGRFTKADRSLPEPGGIPGLVHIDALNGKSLSMEPMRLSSQNGLQVSGWSVVYKKKHRTFIALKDDAGIWYVTLAAPVRRDDMLQLTHFPAYTESAGFDANVSLRGLPVGNYQLHIWEIESGNKGFLSDCLATITIVD